MFILKLYDRNGVELPVPANEINAKEQLSLFDMLTDKQAV